MSALDEQTTNDNRMCTSVIRRPEAPRAVVVAASEQNEGIWLGAAAVAGTPVVHSGHVQHASFVGAELALHLSWTAMNCSSAPRVRLEVQDWQTQGT